MNTTIRQVAPALAIAVAAALPGCESARTSAAAHAVTTPAAAPSPPHAEAGRAGSGPGGPDGEDHRASDDRSALHVIRLGPSDRAEGDEEPPASGEPAEPPAQEEAAYSPPPLPGANPDAVVGPKPVIDDVWPNRAPASGGERIELHGKNLQPALVLFGSVPASVLDVREADGDVTLTLLAPPARAGPAPVWIVVTNRDGSHAVAAQQFEYYR